MAKQDPWPKIAPSPPAWALTPDCYLKSDRSLAGPLRLGTAPGVGPKGGLAGGFGTDFGTDRVTPRGFDPMGTSDTRAPRQEATDRVSSEIRRGRFQRRSDND